MSRELDTEVRQQAKVECFWDVVLETTFAISTDKKR